MKKQDILKFFEGERKEELIAEYKRQYELLVPCIRAYNEHGNVIRRALNNTLRDVPGYMCLEKLHGAIDNSVHQAIAPYNVHEHINEIKDLQKV